MDDQKQEHPSGQDKSAAQIPSIASYISVGTERSACLKSDVMDMRHSPSYPVTFSCRPSYPVAVNDGNWFSH